MTDHVAATEAETQMAVCMSESVLAEITLVDLEATEQLAAKLAAVLKPGDVIALDGPLGIGKTAFARGLIRHLVGAETEVPSPTFNLVFTYDVDDGPLWHFDLFRIEQPEDVYELGIEEAFADGISLIEWPERLGGLLPQDCLTLTFLAGANDGARRVRMIGSETWRRRLEELIGDG